MVSVFLRDGRASQVFICHSARAMNPPTKQFVDSNQNEEEYEDRSRVSVFVFLAVFPLVILLVVAMTEPEPKNTTHQMGEFLGNLNESQPEPESPDIMAAANKTKSVAASKSTMNSAELSASNPKPRIAANERPSSARHGYFAGWSRWVKQGFERLQRKWFD